MDQNNRKRPAEHTVKDRPRTPASRPRDARPRTGNAAARDAARRERLRAPEPAAPAAKRAAPARKQPERETKRAAPAREQPGRETKRARSAPEKQVPKRGSRAPKRSAPEPAQEEQPAVSRRKKRKPHRVYNTNFGFKFVTMLAVVAVIVLSMIIFFKVKHIEVVLQGVVESAEPAAESTGETAGEVSADPTGETAGENGGDSTGAQTGTETAARSSYYTADEIIAASGIHIDDNLLSLSKATIASRIKVALPYVRDVQVKKQLPGTVIITVSEFEVTYGIQDEAGGWWLMSRDGRILQSVEEQKVRGHLIVTGMPIQVPQPGDWFKPAATDGADLSEIAAKQKVVLEVIPALESMPFVKELVSVDVSTSYDLILWYGTRYEIKLGTTENLSYKLQFLQAALENSDVQHRSGVIDLTFNEDDKVHFLEFR